MRVLLVSSYELGHQPVHLASPAAALLRAGHDVRCLDLSVQPWDWALADWSEAVALSVPMHTAMRLATRVMRALRRTRPGLPLACYGLYAPMAGDATVSGLADRALAGEYEPELLEWVDEIARGRVEDAKVTRVSLGRTAFSLPARHLLPPLDRYAHLLLGGEERRVGALEASHGCSHRCRHCPVPSIYGGRTRAVDEELIAADIDQLADMGARHITFADPDFLNRPQHALRVARSLHQRQPDLTFDCTVKVEHILRYPDVWPELAEAGCIFVVTAIESVDDETLLRLDKGHTAADAAEAVQLLRHHGIEPRPSFLPFTPWTSLQDVVDLLDFVADLDLIGNVDPVQYTIRLLVPQGSLLIGHDDLQLGPYDTDTLAYPWSSPDPRVDDLQRRLGALVESDTGAGRPIPEIYLRVRRLALEAAATTAPSRPRSGSEELSRAFAAASTEGRPRLTEPWFC